MGVIIHYFLQRFVILTLIVFCYHSQASIKYIFDFDGTITNDHRENASWITPWVLKKVEYRHNTLQPDPSAAIGHPEYLEVSYKEYLRLLPLLAKEERVLGDLNAVELDFDPLNPKRNLKIIPGFYRVSADITYKYYRKSEENFLLRDYIAAKKRTRLRRGLDWRGPAFEMFKKAMEQPQFVVLSTSRGQFEEFDAFIDELRKDKELSHSKFYPRKHALASSDAIIFGKDVTSQKTAVIDAEAKQGLVSPIYIPHKELVSNEGGAKEGETSEVNTLIFFEDYLPYVKATTQKLEELSSDKDFTHKMKFVLFNAVSEEQLKTLRWPWRWTVFDKGFGREALPEEVSFWKENQANNVCANKIIHQ